MHFFVKRLYCWLWLGACAGLWSLLPQRAAASEGPTDCLHQPAVPLLRVSTQIWRVAAARGKPNESNAGVTTQLVLVRDGPRLWLVGTGPSPDFGQALSCAIQKQFAQQVTDVINTRAAPELAMGNSAFEGARIWALADVMAAMQARCPVCQERLKARIGAAGKSLVPDSIRTPNALVNTAAAQRGQLGPFLWTALSRAPGERVLVLRHRQAHIVIAQGLLWAGDVPDLRETHSDTMLRSWRALRVFASGAQLLGEQGDLSRAAALADHIAYLKALRRTALPHLVRGDLDGASGQGLDLPAFTRRPGYVQQHPLNVQHVWRELEPQIFR